MHQLTIDTPHGPVTATWQRSSSGIIVRYGEREKLAQASENDAANEFVARDIVRGWIVDDLSDKEAA